METSRSSALSNVLLLLLFLAVVAVAITIPLRAGNGTTGVARGEQATRLIQVVAVAGPRADGDGPWAVRCADGSTYMIYHQLLGCEAMSGAQIRSLLKPGLSYEVVSVDTYARSQAVVRVVARIREPLD